MFRTDKDPKRTAAFTKGDKVRLKIDRSALSEARYAEALEVFNEVWEVKYYSFTHQNWVCQDVSGNQCMFEESKIELVNEEQKDQQAI